METLNENNLNDVLKTIQQHPLINKIFKDKEDDTNAKRKLAMEIIDRVKHEQEKAMPGHNEAISRAEEALAEARKNVTETEKALTWATHKRMAASIEAGQAIQAQENLLRETCNPAINETIAFFNERLDAIRKRGILRQEFPGKKNLYTLKREPFAYSNVEAVNACMEYLRAGIAKMESWKLELIGEKELQELLGKLKREIPDTDEQKYYEPKI
jgi:hypothetical protein